MSYRIQWSATALDRLIKILDFIADDRPASASKVVDDLLAQVETLAQFPNRCPAFGEGSDPELRKFTDGKYIVVYRVQEARRVISVIAVRHGRQQPLTLEDILEDEKGWLGP